MKTELLDAPAMVLPHVLDVHGTLLRLGFKGHSVKGRHFYRQMVPLFKGGVKAQHGSRRISHLSVTIEISEDRGIGSCWVRYGYPTLKLRRKLVEGFVTLTSDTTFTSLRLSPDQDLRETEKALRFLIDQMRTKELDCTIEQDTEAGVVAKTSIPGYEAVVQAVMSTIGNRHINLIGEWWLDDPAPPAPHEPYAQERVHPRLPNFQRNRPQFHHTLARSRGR